MNPESPSMSRREFLKNVGATIAGVVSALAVEQAVNLAEGTTDLKIGNSVVASAPKDCDGKRCITPDAVIKATIINPPLENATYVASPVLFGAPKELTTGEKIDRLINGSKGEVTRREFILFGLSLPIFTIMHANNNGKLDYSRLPLHVIPFKLGMDFIQVKFGFVPSAIFHSAANLTLLTKEMLAQN